MKKTIRFFLILLVLMLSVMTFGACSGGKNEDVVHTITFEPENGTVMETQKVVSGNKIIAPSDVTRMGYTLEGWYVSLNGGITYDEQWEFIKNKVLNDVTLYAKWVANSYTVSFYTGFGNAESPISATYDSVLTLPFPTRTGHAFVGWCSDAELLKPYSGTHMPAQDFTLYAKWQVLEYTVTYVSNNNTDAVDFDIYDYGTVMERPINPTRQGHEFVGWSEADNPFALYTFTTMPARDITLFAQWKAIEYTITLNTNNGTDLAPIVQEIGTIVYPPSDPTREGYSFAGWFSNSTFTNIYTFTVMPYNGQTVYAKWDANSYLIEFDSNGGSPVSSIYKAYDSAVTKPADPTRTGYTFMGWFTDFDPYNAYVFGKIPSFDLELTAKWELNFTYTSNYSSATITGVSQVGQSVVSLEVPEYIGSYSVTAIGNNAFSNCTNIKSMSLPNSITSIGSSAFENCSSLDTINIPNKLSTLGEFAFRGCAKLEDVDFSQNNALTTLSNGLFSGCDSLSDVTFSSFITTISSNAFQNCKGLEEIYVPSSVTSIGSGTFAGCESLESISLPFVGASRYATYSESVFGYVFGTVSYPNSYYVSQYYSGSYYHLPEKLAKVDIYETNIPAYAFYACSRIVTVSLPNNPTISDYAFYSCNNLESIDYAGNIQSIGTYAFYNCNKLDGITLSSQLSSLGTYAFYSCSALTSITIPSSVQTIGNYAFNGCSSLADLTIEYGVTTIGDYAFAYCNALTTIAPSSSVTTIGSGTFRGCSSLVNFYMPNSVQTIGSYAFQDCILLSNITIPGNVQTISDYAFNRCTSLSSVTIDYGVQKTIGSYAFSGCTSLSSVYLPSSVTAINSSAFSGCTNLSSISIPSSVKSIGSYVFSGCTSLSSVSIDYGGVQSIGDYAFSGCTALSSINIPTTVTSIGSYAFENCTSLPIIYISEYITSMGSYVFYGWTASQAINVSNSAVRTSWNYDWDAGHFANIYDY